MDTIVAKTYLCIKESKEFGVGGHYLLTVRRDTLPFLTLSEYDLEESIS